MRDIMKIPYAEPGTSKKNKTGGAARNPDIDKDVCIGCGQCIDHCPDSCIHFDENRKAEVDIDYCKGCGICESVCPVKAIVMKERK
jgi:pyruvate ferredoxin oxidoreductase delta subunit